VVVGNRMEIGRGGVYPTLTAKIKNRQTVKGGRQHVAKRAGYGREVGEM